MNILVEVKRLAWRKLPLAQRHRILDGVQRALPAPLFRHFMHFVGGGVYRQEVRDSGVLFIHIPKTAGTSVARGLYGIDGVGHYKAVDARRLNPALFDRLYRFSITRNPWERLLSAYRFALQGGTDDVLLHNHDFYKPFAGKTFEHFVLDWLLRQDPRRLDPIFTPQVHYVCDDQGRLLVDMLYDIGDLASAERDLSARLRRPVAIGRSNTTGAMERVLEHHYRDPDVLAAVGHYYADDVRRFGYAFPLADSAAAETSPLSLK